MSDPTLNGNLRSWVRLPALWPVSALAFLTAAGLAVDQDEGFPTLGPEEDRIVRYFPDEDLADPIAELRKGIESGAVKLAFDEKRGYLPALLEYLKVPLDSQTLVFSKTSSQSPFTSPRTPRALYFNDRAYIAWVPDGDEVDLVGIDPLKGPVFYTIKQMASEKPKIEREKSCMRCHIGPRTLNVPGLFVRSVMTDPDGRGVGEIDGFVSGHNNPLEHRWAGWYVTGTHGQDRHLGNATLPDRRQPATLNPVPGSNLTDIRPLFDHERYLSAESDTVALLVLDHVVRMQNLITLLRYETLYALDDKRAKEGSDGERQAWVTQRIETYGEALLSYLLFRDEAPMKGPVKGTSVFEARFPTAGPRDTRGRSLREFDLQTRLFKYPCSYMIYSTSFDSMPTEAKEYVWRRLETILGGWDKSPMFVGMPEDDRLAVREILLDTKPEYHEWVGRSKTGTPLTNVPLTSGAPTQ